MDLLMILVLIAMGLTFLENTFVAFIAYQIYLRQTKANAEMEARINEAIEDVKKHMASDKILGNLKKSLIRTMNGWISGKKSGVSRTAKNAASALGGIGLLRKMKDAKGDDRLWIMAEYAAEKYAEQLAKKEEEEQTTEPEVKTVDDYQKANMTPDQYKELYEEGLKEVQSRQKE